MAAADLVGIVEDIYGVRLKKSGTNLVGKSPFSNEKTPSFFIDPVNQFYKCFSTGKGGDAITLIRELDAVGFIDAVKIIAKHYNIALDEEQNPEFSEKEKLVVAVQSLQNIYRESLPGSDAEGYLNQRFGKELVDKFALGYQPLDCDKSLLKKVGMLSEKGYPMTKGRAMFPVRNSQGTILSFTGRRLDDEKKAKYINGYTTKLYDKSDALYGEFEAFRNIIKLKWGIIVEGNPDVIAGHFKNAFGNTLAPMGTILSDSQALRMARYDPYWTIFMDGDRAGINAVNRIAEPLMKLGVNVSVMPLGASTDPFDYWKAGGSFTKEDCLDFFEFYKSVFGAVENVYRLVNVYLGGIKDTLMRQYAARRLCRLFDIGFIRLENEVRTFKGSDKTLGELTTLIEKTFGTIAY